MFLFQKVLSFSLLPLKVIFSSPQSLACMAVDLYGPPQSSFQRPPVCNPHHFLRVVVLSWFLYYQWSALPTPNLHILQHHACTYWRWLSSPRAENTATIERNCGPWSDPGTFMFGSEGEANTPQCMSNLLSLFCSYVMASQPFRLLRTAAWQPSELSAL